jgi:hypothetical protein
MMRNMLPKDKELPTSKYGAKKIICPLGLEAQKIHACPYDCILYRGDYENLTECRICTALRYKIRGDDPGDVEGELPRVATSNNGSIGAYLLRPPPWYHRFNLVQRIEEFPGRNINGRRIACVIC